MSVVIGLEHVPFLTSPDSRRLFLIKAINERLELAISQKSKAVLVDINFLSYLIKTTTDFYKE